MIKNKNNLILLLLLVLFAIGAFFFLANKKSSNDRAFNLKKPSKLMKADKEKDKKFEKAIDPREFTFPHDHGPHKAFKTEWWYYTGNLEDEDSNEFGYQITIFRNGLEPEKDSPKPKNNKWQSKQVYMAHFAISDIDNKKFYSFEKYSRDSVALAGAKAEPHQVWLKNWSIKSFDNKEGETFPVLITAKEKDIELQLELDPVKPITLQGLNGLSQKTQGLGNASYYYSISKLASVGNIKIKDKTYKVKGYSWLDREWSTSSLGDNLVGWDWFALQLSNDIEIMYYRLRDGEGGSDPHSSGVIIDSEGQSHSFSYKDIKLKEKGYFHSSYSDAKYPINWSMEIPKIDLNINIKSNLKDQEHRNQYPYYEGSVSINGKFADKKIAGKGYMELVGY